jgi:large subunit ribosomal protein L24
MASLKIQRNDTVQVITGSDRGKQGRVLRVMPDEGRILVEHVRMVKKNVRPNPQRNIKGGIAEQEAALQISNVMLVCSNCGPTRVGYKFEGDTKFRVCKKCGQTLVSKSKKK